MTLEQMTPQDWSYLADKAHRNAVAKGFYDQTPSHDHLRMLAICELVEAIEADRKGRRAVVSEEIDDYVDEAFVTDFNARIKDTVEDELADFIIRCLDYVGWRRATYDWGELEISLDFYQPDEWRKVEGIAEMSYYAISELISLSVTYALECVLSYCQFAGIDIMRHVELKMRYNELRPRLHGKKY